MLLRFNTYQALLSVLTIILAYMLFNLVAGRTVAMITALLTAIAPHLITMTTYLLTETQFTFLLLFGMLALAQGVRGTHVRWVVPQPSTPLYLPLAGQSGSPVSGLNKHVGWAVFGGFLLGLSALTRTTTEYLPLFLAPFLLWTLGQRAFLRIGLPAIATALAVIIAWKIRNFIAIGATSDPTLLTNTISHGMYPNFMYNNMPESYGFPYRFDPFAMQVHTTFEVFRELFRRVGEDPWTYIHWYLIGKPFTLLSWNIIGGAGGIFVYPVTASPYMISPLFQATEIASVYLHFFLTMAALVGCGIVLFRPRVFALRSENHCIAVLIVALILYFLAVHMVGAPFPRYGIPLRPIIYGLGLWTLAALGKHLRLRVMLPRDRKMENP
jgi:4-amino-4-deoxy-L-arabinose transferase-like glycosyltransferase